MRHCKKKGRLNRRTSWRKATLKCMANGLIKYQRIETTMAKAKALRVFIEPLITLAKKDKDSVAARRRAFQKLCDRDMVKRLFDHVGPLYKNISGGYTRIMAVGIRKGDGAQTAIIEFTKRTIPDEDLLGKTKVVKKEKKKKPAAEKVKEDEAKKTTTTKKKTGSSKINAEKKEEHSVEDMKKEKAKTEQKKVAQKGLFKRFRRKSI